MQRRSRFAVLVALALATSLAGCKKKPKVGAEDGGAPAVGATAPTSAGAGAAQSGEGVIVWPMADLRATPAQNGEVTAKLGNGVRVLVLERRDGWSRVRTVEGQKEGWLLSQAVQGGVVLGAGVAVSPTAVAVPSRGQIRVDKSGVRLRESPNGQRFTVLGRGITLNIVRDEGQWLQVEGAGKKGWVARKVVVVLPPTAVASPGAQANTAAPNTATPNTALPAPAGGATGLGEGKVLFKTLNLREKPDGNQLSTLPQGARVVLLAQTKVGDNAFMQVRADDGRTGWVVARAIQRLAGRISAPAAPPPAATPVAVAAPPSNTPPPAAPTAPESGSTQVTWPRVNLRESPPKGRVLGTLTKGDAVVVLARQGKFVQVRAGEKEGWVIASALASAGSAAAAPHVAATAPQPKAPATKPRHPDNEGDEDATAAPATAGRAYIVSWTNVNVRKGPSRRDVAVDKFSRGTRVREVGTEGNWIEVQTADGSRKGWVSKNALRPAQ